MQDPTDPAVSIFDRIAIPDEPPISGPDSGALLLRLLINVSGVLALLGEFGRCRAEWLSDLDAVLDSVNEFPSLAAADLLVCSVEGVHKGNWAASLYNAAVDALSAAHVLSDVPGDQKAKDTLLACSDTLSFHARRLVAVARVHGEHVADPMTVPFTIPAEEFPFGPLEGSISEVAQWIVGGERKRYDFDDLTPRIDKGLIHATKLRGNVIVMFKHRPLAAAAAKRAGKKIDEYGIITD